MEERTRIRTIWLLAAVVAAYALMNVIVFYTTGAFGPVWFATSLLVYGVLMVAAVGLAIVDRTPSPDEVHARELARARIKAREAHRAWIEQTGEGTPT